MNELASPWWRRTEQQLTGRFTMVARAPALQLAKAAGAAVLSWFVCLLFFPGSLPMFGAIAALIVVQESVDQSLTKGIERVVGVMFGVSVALGAGALFGQNSWLFIAAILVSMSVGWLLRMSATSTNQIAITAMLMIALGGSELGYGVERLVETAIGAAIGVAVNAIVAAPVRTNVTRSQITDLTLHAAEALGRLADALEKPRDDAWLEGMLEEARELHEERAQVHASLRSARESLRLNPRSRRHMRHLLEDDALFQRVQPIVTQVIGMSRALYDLYAPELVDDASVIGMRREIRRAAHDLALLVSEPIGGETETAPEPPALTAPYTIPRPPPEHWVLIGSLMEDLRRVRGRITGELD